MNETLPTPKEIEYVRVRLPAFPTNRQIIEGEPCCHVCGSGLAHHKTESLGHRFELDPDASMFERFLHWVTP